MIQLPKRNSLIHETASTLKQWIASGVLKDVLPGELDLKERLRVGRDTLRLALQLLTDEGWVEPSVQGRKRKIHPQKHSGVKKRAKAELPVTFISPYASEQGQTMLELADTQKRLLELGRELQFVSPDIFHLKDPEHQLQNLVQTHPSAAWILSASSQPIQNWFAQQGLPTLIHGWPYPGINLPYVAKDWGPAGFHAGLQFIRHGHRNIGMFEYVERGVGAMLIEQGLRRAIDTAGNGAKLLMFKDDRTPESIAKMYDAAFKLKDRPTAMVLTSSNHLLTSMSWLISKGIAVPADVSLVVLPHDVWYSEFVPPLCYYKPNTNSFSHGIAERVLELVEFGRIIHKPLAVPVEFVPGATIGPVPKLKA
ncbi:MAG TPA: substrate-binding domain-containing protein [Verrucomicrobiae bacterium]|jgi:DNA-binding LacI/PurR family transcriptional regulator